MSQTTPIYALPYPDETDTADVPRDVQALAAAARSGAPERRAPDRRRHRLVLGNDAAGAVPALRRLRDQPHHLRRAVRRDRRAVGRRRRHQHVQPPRHPRPRDRRRRTRRERRGQRDGPDRRHAAREPTGQARAHERADSAPTTGTTSTTPSHAHSGSVVGAYNYGNQGGNNNVQAGTPHIQIANVGLGFNTNGA